MAELSVCTVCKQEKPTTDFRWNSRTGLRTECKACELHVLRCSSCKELKPHDAFPPCKKMSTGKHSLCLDCHAKRTVNRYRSSEEVRDQHRRQSQGERARAWRRQYVSRPEIREKSRKYHARQTNWLYHNDIIYRLKVKARGAVFHAVKTGKILVPDSCQSNGRYGVSCEGRLEAHHWHGYWPRTAWLDVEWLCVACHKAADEQLDKNFSIVFRSDDNPVYQAIARRVDRACDALGIDEESLFGATLECAGEDECDTFLKVIDWLRINGYTIEKPEPPA